MNEYEAIEDVLDALRYQSRMGSYSELGYSALKNSGSKDFLGGMAHAYLSAAETDPENTFSTGSEQLDKMIRELRQEMLTDVLRELFNAMEGMLTTMLDQEAEEGEE